MVMPSTRPAATAKAAALTRMRMRILTAMPSPGSAWSAGEACHKPGSPATHPVHAALDASTPFTEVSNGFAGAESDGLTQLDRDHALTTTFADGLQGDLVQTARGRPVRRPRRHPRPRVRRHPGEAVATAGGALRTGFSRALLRHAAGWADYAHMVGSARPGQ